MRDQNNEPITLRIESAERPEDEHDHTEDPAGTFALTIERAHVGALDEMANVVKKILSGEIEPDLNTILSSYSTFAHLRSAAALASIANNLEDGRVGSIAHSLKEET